MEISFPCYQQNSILLNKPLTAIPITRKRLSNRNSNLLPCHCSLSSSSDETAKSSTIALQHDGRRALIASLLAAATGIFVSDVAEAVSTSRRAPGASKVSESEFTTLPNGLKLVHQFIPILRARVVRI